MQSSPQVSTEKSREFIKDYFRNNPLSNEDIQEIYNELREQGTLSEEEYRKYCRELKSSEELLEEAQLNIINKAYTEEDVALVQEFLASFKKASFKQRRQMSIDELAKYYAELRKYDYFRGKELNGIKARQKIHFLVSFILGIDQLCSLERKKRVGEKKVLSKSDRPKIYACTHIGGNDVQRAFQIIKDPAWLMFGNPGIVYKKVIYQGLKMNGVLPLETFDKVDRKIVYNRALEVLAKGGNLLIYPEGAWNVSPNELIMKLFVGTVRIAQESGAEIIPLALEQYKKTFYYQLGEGYTIPKDSKKSIYELRDELREKLATLKWNILLTQEMLQRENIPEEYLEEFQAEIIGRCNYGYGFSLEDALREKFYDKTIASEEEVFAFLKNLDIQAKNAFLAKDQRRLVLKK